MRRRDFVRTAAGATLPLAIGRSAFAGTRVTLALHYMTWLTQGSWSFASTWPVLHDPSYPLPRGYDSDDPLIFRAHNEIAARHHFAWLWSWWGQSNEPGGDGTLRRYLDEDPGSSVPLLLLYELTALLTQNRDGFYNFNDPANYRRLVEDLAFLERTYWSNPRYAHRFFRIDGRPVFFIWLTGQFIGNWAAAVTAARREAAFYLVGSAFGLGLTPEGPPLVRADLAEMLAPLDAVSSYGIYDPNYVPASGRFDAGLASRYERAVRGWAELLPSVAPHVRFIPPLQFAYDDRYARPEARHPPLVSSVAEALVVARAARGLIDDALAGDPRYRCVLPVVFLASWNEHIEGSAVEWTDEHGYGYLLAAASTFRD